MTDHFKSPFSKQMKRRQFLKISGGIAGLTLMGSYSDANTVFADEKSFSFAVIADSHTDPTVPKRSNYLKAIYSSMSSSMNSTEREPAFIMHVGDLVEAGLAEEYQEFVRLLPSRYKENFHAVPGNHEVRWDEWAGELYKDLFGPSQYSFDCGDVHFIALDPTQLLQEPGYFTEAQLKWLEDDLKKTGRKKPVIVYVHYPIGDNNYYITNEESFFQTVEHYNVRAVFTGHVHNGDIWKQNGLTLLSLPAAKNGPFYYWVEKENSSTGSAALSVYHMKVDLNGSPVEKKRLITIPLSGDRPAIMEKPRHVHYQPPSPVSSTANLDVELSPRSSVKEVLFQFWPESRYAGRDEGNWQPLVPTGTGKPAMHWQTNIEVEDIPSGVYRLQVRVINEKAEYWDEFLQVTISNPKERLSWEKEQNGPVRAEIVTADFEKGAQPMLIVCAGDESVTALDPQKGKTIWKNKTEGAILGKPALDDQNRSLFAGTITNTVFALSTDSGKTAWTFRAPKPVLGSPMWVKPEESEQELLLVPSGKSMLGLNAETGQMIWSSKTKGLVGGHPSSDGASAFFGSGDGSVYAVELQTGKIVWKQTIITRENPYKTLIYSLWATHAAVIPDEPSQKQLVLVSNVTHTYALDRSTGEVVWKLKGGFLYSAPLLLEEEVRVAILADEWGNVFSVDPYTGSVHWKTATAQRIFNASPVKTGDKVYISGVNGLLTGLNLKTGAIEDEFHFSTDYVYSTPAYYEGMIIQGGQDGIVRAITLNH
jgi:outer membrane protein assembly factor BamB/predicted phosphodiesterase